MTYTFIEDEVTADLSIEAEATTLQELFTDLATAAIVALADPQTVQPVEEKKIHLENTDVEKLLFELLEEIIFLKDKDAFVYHDSTISITEKGDTQVLDCTLRGDAIDHTKQVLRNDLKAVTLHTFSVRQENGKWLAKVVIDL